MHIGSPVQPSAGTSRRGTGGRETCEKSEKGVRSITFNGKNITCPTQIQKNNGGKGFATAEGTQKTGTKSSCKGVKEVSRKNSREKGSDDRAALKEKGKSRVTQTVGPERQKELKNNGGQMDAPKKKRTQKITETK